MYQLFPDQYPMSSSFCGHRRARRRKALRLRASALAAARHSFAFALIRNSPYRKKSEEKIFEKNHTLEKIYTKARLYAHDKTQR